MILKKNSKFRDPCFCLLYFIIIGVGVFVGLRSSKVPGSLRFRIKAKILPNENIK